MAAATAAGWAAAEEEVAMVATTGMAVEATAAAVEQAVGAVAGSAVAAMVVAMEAVVMAAAMAEGMAGLVATVVAMVGVATAEAEVAAMVVAGLEAVMAAVKAAAATEAVAVAVVAMVEVPPTPAGAGFQPTSRPTCLGRRRPASVGCSRAPAQRRQARSSARSSWTRTSRSQRSAQRSPAA